MRIYDFLKNVMHLQDEELIQQLLYVTEIRHMTRREVLVREGDVQKVIGFVISGCLCGFSQNAEGEELVTCFACRPGEPTMLSFALTEPAMGTMVALVDSEVLCVPTEEVARLVHSSMACLELYNNLLEQSLKHQVMLNLIISRGRAMDRYRWFLKEYPGLIDTINNKYIASYLQMTNVTLSRLRRADRERRHPDKDQPAGELPAAPAALTD